jgi:hypothetical protein
MATPPGIPGYPIDKRKGSPINPRPPRNVPPPADDAPPPGPED